MAFQDEIFPPEGKNPDLKICLEAETMHPKMTIRPLDEQARSVKSRI